MTRLDNCQKYLYEIICTHDCYAGSLQESERKENFKNKKKKKAVTILRKPDSKGGKTGISEYLPGNEQFIYTHPLLHQLLHCKSLLTSFEYSGFVID